MKQINKILESYDIKGNISDIDICNQGNINSTYIVKYDTGESYIIQKINTSVFENPYVVMNNIELVTKKLTKSGVMRNPLEIVYTKENMPLISLKNEHGEKEYYRCYKYIQNCISYNNLNDAIDPNELAYNAGYAFGLFHKALDGMPTDSINETIPNFHNTPKRIEDLLESIKIDIMHRAKEYAYEIVDLLTRSDDVSYIYDNLGNKIPLRVTHNDTKLNNILFDKDTNEVISVIDLDTLMPGSALFDIGDGIRSSCAKSFEDETDPSKISIDLDLTKSYLSGYLDMMGDVLTKDEINNIALSIKTLTYELAIRFLKDYLDGDVYFKTNYPHHNADRFKNQYLLMLDIERKEEEIQEFVDEYVRKRK